MNTIQIAMSNYELSNKTKCFILALIIQFFFSNVSWTQEHVSQLSLTRGMGFAKLQDQLWGNQVYKGVIKQYALNYEWHKNKGCWNQLSLVGGNGVLEVPNSIRKNTDAYQMGIRYQHLRTVTTIDGSQINWAVGGAVSTFVEFRVQNQYSSNNAFSYDLGSSLELQNRFDRTFLLKNKKKLHCSFLIETAFLTAYLRPDYASSDTEDPLGLGGLNEVTFGTITSRMRWVSFPTFVRVNMYTVLDYSISEKFGFRMQYNWHLLHAEQKLEVTSVSHQIHFGAFLKFGKIGAKPEVPFVNANDQTFN